jgi:hypothetical protein
MQGSNATRDKTRPKKVLTTTDAVYDLDHNGVLDNVEQIIRRYDADGSGTFSLTEVRNIVHDLEAAKADAKRMHKIVSFSFLAVLLVCCTMLAITIIGNEISKDQDQSSSGKLLVKGTDTVVQTASADMAVATDGSLIQRCPPNADGSTTQCKATKLNTNALTPHALTSRVPNKYLQQLKTFEYVDPTDDAQTPKSVTVHGFTRKPQAGALCGSVVVLDTSEGNFILDDKHMYHADLELWINVAGMFDVGKRRRLQAKDVGAVNAVGIFGLFDAGSETFECTRSWMNETETIKPTSFKVPYSYTSYSIQSCWEEIKDVDRPQPGLNLAQPKGSEARCRSTYGPNAGKYKPGVSKDGKYITSISKVLITENQTVTIQRFPNHPFQVEVTVETKTIGGNMTQMYFQISDDEKHLRQRCFKQIVPDPQDPLASFDNLTISYLGTEGLLRRWAVSDKDNIPIGHYYDFNNESNGFPPHSVRYTFGGLTPEFSGERFIDMNTNMSEAAVQDWLDDEFAHAYLYDVVNDVGCGKADRLTNVPDIDDAFDENPDAVDYYTKQMVKSSNKELDELMQDTTFDVYWGATLQLQRLFASQATPTNSEASTEDASAQAATYPSIDFTDPYFWREVGTRNGITSISNVNSFWQDLAKAGTLKAPELSILQMTSALSGLPTNVLRSVPFPVDYVAKLHVAGVDGDSFTVSESVFSGTPQEYVQVGDVAQVVHANMTCGASFALTAVPGNGSRLFTALNMQSYGVTVGAKILVFENASKASGWNCNSSAAKIMSVPSCLAPAASSANDQAVCSAMDIALPSLGSVGSQVCRNTNISTGSCQYKSAQANSLAGRRRLHDVVHETSYEHVSTVFCASEKAACESSQQCSAELRAALSADKEPSSGSPQLLALSKCVVQKQTASSMIPADDDVENDDDVNVEYLAPFDIEATAGTEKLDLSRSGTCTAKANSAPEDFAICEAIGLHCDKMHRHAQNICENTETVSGAFCLFMADNTSAPHRRQLGGGGNIDPNSLAYWMKDQTQDVQPLVNRGQGVSIQTGSRKVYGSDHGIGSPALFPGIHKTLTFCDDASYSFSGAQCKDGPTVNGGTAKCANHNNRVCGIEEVHLGLSHKNPYRFLCKLLAADLMLSSITTIMGTGMLKDVCARKADSFTPCGAGEKDKRKYQQGISLLEDAHGFKPKTLRAKGLAQQLPEYISESSTYKARVYIRQCRRKCGGWRWSWSRGWYRRCYTRCRNVPQYRTRVRTQNTHIKCSSGVETGIKMHLVVPLDIIAAAAAMPHAHAHSHGHMTLKEFGKKLGKKLAKKLPKVGRAYYKNEGVKDSLPGRVLKAAMNLLQMPKFEWHVYAVGLLAEGQCMTPRPQYNINQARNQLDYKTLRLDVKNHLKLQMCDDRTFFSFAVGGIIEVDTSYHGVIKATRYDSGSSLGNWRFDKSSLDFALYGYAKLALYGGGCIGSCNFQGYKNGPWPERIRRSWWLPDCKEWTSVTGKAEVKWKAEITREPNTGDEMLAFKASATYKVTAKVVGLRFSISVKIPEVNAGGINVGQALREMSPI